MRVLKSIPGSCNWSRFCRTGANRHCCDVPQRDAVHRPRACELIDRGFHSRAASQAHAFDAAYARAQCATAQGGRLSVAERVSRGSCKHTTTTVSAPGRSIRAIAICVRSIPSLERIAPTVPMGYFRNNRCMVVTGRGEPAPHRICLSCSGVRGGRTTSKTLALLSAAIKRTSGMRPGSERRRERPFGDPEVGNSGRFDAKAPFQSGWSLLLQTYARWPYPAPDNVVPLRRPRIRAKNDQFSGAHPSLVTSAREHEPIESTTPVCFSSPNRIACRIRNAAEAMAKRLIWAAVSSDLSTTTSDLHRLEFKFDSIGPQR